MRSKFRGLLSLAVALYAAGVLAAFVSVGWLADCWWPATLLIFGPRWLVATPLAVLVPAALLLRSKRVLGALAACALLVFGPVMGLVVPNPLSRPEGARLRVMTQNLGGAPLDTPAFVRLLRELEPDVVGLQECPGDGESPDPAYHFHRGFTTCLLSRLPILKVDDRDPKDAWERNGSGAVTLYDLAGPAGRIQLLNVHLETVREGLEAIRASKLAGVPELEANTGQRRWESEIALEWSRRATAPLFVTGDFNMPQESAIYRDLWSGFVNAFAAGGAGYGFTKKTRHFGARVDHVLAAPGIRVERAWVEGSVGSDHDAVVADLRL